MLYRLSIWRQCRSHQNDASPVFAVQFSLDIAVVVRNQYDEVTILDTGCEDGLATCRFEIVLNLHEPCFVPRARLSRDGPCSVRDTCRGRDWSRLAGSDEFAIVPGSRHRVAPPSNAG